MNLLALRYKLARLALPMKISEQYELENKKVVMRTPGGNEYNINSIEVRDNRIVLDAKQTSTPS